MGLRFRNVEDGFNWREDLHENMFYLGAIHGSDGNAQHAVTLYRNWIFDSNEKRAIPLGKEGLDFCTQSEEERDLTGSTSVFSHFQNGVLIWDVRTNGKRTKREAKSKQRKKRRKQQMKRNSDRKKYNERATTGEQEKEENGTGDRKTEEDSEARYEYMSL
jgi:hypothetical protein